MDDNQRDSFRLERYFDAELFHEGRVAECTVLNLSAGGARIETMLEMRIGTNCTLGVRLEGSLQREAGVDYVSFHQEVLELTQLTGGMNEYRLRNATGVGSNEYEAAARLVISAQRQAIAAETGANESSPMVSDEQRRRRFRLPSKARFTRGSLRPGSGD